MVNIGLSLRKWPKNNLSFEFMALYLHRKLQLWYSTQQKVIKTERGARGCHKNTATVDQNYPNHVHIGLYYENGQKLTLTLLSFELYLHRKLQLQYNTKQKVIKVERGARGCHENTATVVQNYPNYVHIGLYYENGRKLTLTLLFLNFNNGNMAILAEFCKIGHVQGSISQKLKVF